VSTTEVASLVEHLIPAVPRPQPAPRRPRKRARAHPATALLGVGLVAVTLVMGAAVLTLRSDVVRLQHQLPAAHQVTCADLQNHVRLHVRNRAVRCTRKG
jgi:hypothetical protein